MYIFIYIYSQRCILSLPLLLSSLELRRNSFACVCLDMCAQKMLSDKDKDRTIYLI